jgi:hypothetical protein
MSSSGCLFAEPAGLIQVLARSLPPAGLRLHDNDGRTSPTQFLRLKQRPTHFPPTASPALPDVVTAEKALQHP